MKAVMYTEYGPPEVLQFTDCPKPVPGDHEILVRRRVIITMEDGSGY